MEALWASNAFCDRGVACNPDSICENSRALPPFPTWEGVVATEIGDAGRAPGFATCGEAVEGVTKSMTDLDGFAVPDFAPKQNVS